MLGNIGGPKIQPVILSGGAGTRLWPLSRPEFPKQFLSLTGEMTMLQATASRLTDFTRYHSPMIVGSHSHLDEMQRQMSAMRYRATYILEPEARNTAPAIALAALLAEPEKLMLVMPSDHVIKDVEIFEAAVCEAVVAAEDGYLVTFGIAPNAPATGFGYIKRGEPLSRGVSKVERFVEKPDHETACGYLEEGGYYWNSGIFLFRASSFVGALNAHAPSVLEACRAALDSANKEEAETVISPRQLDFSRSPSISVDYAVMEQSDRVAVVPVEMGWSDIGTWDAVYDYLQVNDASPNTDRTFQIDSRGCLLRSDGPLIAVVNVDDIIVIASKGEVLVVRRGDSQRVREVVEQLERCPPFSAI